MRDNDDDCKDEEDQSATTEPENEREPAMYAVDIDEGLSTFDTAAARSGAGQHAEASDEADGAVAALCTAVGEMDLEGPEPPSSSTTTTMGRAENLSEHRRPMPPQEEFGQEATRAKPWLSRSPREP